MNGLTVSIREFRTNFRSVRRKLALHGQIVITDHGVPRFLLQTLPGAPKKRRPMPDYYARLVKLQPKSLSAEAAQSLTQENRGDR